MSFATVVTGRAEKFGHGMPDEMLRQIVIDEKSVRTAAITADQC